MEENADDYRDLSAEASGDDAMLVRKEDFTIVKERLDAFEEFKELAEGQTKAFVRALASVPEEVQSEMKMLLGKETVVAWSINEITSGKVSFTHTFEFDERKPI